jgi:hypothetical protein
VTASSADLTGNLSVSASGQTITAQRQGGSPSTTAAHTLVRLKLTGLQNPAVSGTTAAFSSLLTRAAAGGAVIDEASSANNSGQVPVGLAIVPGTLPAGVTVTPSSTAAGAAMTVAVQFTARNAWSAGGALVLNFPASVTVGATVGISGASFTGSVSASSSGRAVTVVRAAGVTAVPAGGSVSFTLSGFANPGVSGATGGFSTFELRTSAAAGSAVIDDAAAGEPAGWTVSAGAFAAAPTVTLNSRVAAATLVQAAVVLTLGNALPPDGAIAVTFPAGFVLTGVNAQLVDASGLLGDCSAGVSGQKVTVSTVTAVNCCNSL